MRVPWLYRRPWLLILVSLPFAFATAPYVVWCWLRARVYEPLLLFPAILAARLAYSAGMVAGGLRWLRDRGAKGSHRPRWE